MNGEVRMTFDEAMVQLEALGTEQNRKVYRRHGAGENQFGVSVANLRRLAKQIGRDNRLAAELWRSGNQDARSLATLVADPRTLPAGELDAWAQAIDYYVVADMFSSLAGLSPDAAKLAERWTNADHEYVEQAGWNVIGVLAMRDRALPDAWFESHLARIEREIGGAKNRVRHAMNNALIAIGVRNASLRAQAEAAARRIGRVMVDHGETGCVTPEALAYIDKAWARRKSA
jgi:3-methyladenine DNA glycosylase AlkD